jgi:uncharacterized protein YjbJ (UPF0337 family)
MSAMVNEQMLQGRWDEVRGKVRQRWGQLTSDEVDQVRGSAEQLVGLIERKTGETRQAIETFLGDLLAEGSEMSARLGEAARQATETAQEAYQRTAERARAGYEQAQGFFREHPAGSIATIFALGLVAGVVLGVLSSSE